VDTSKPVRRLGSRNKGVVIKGIRFRPGEVDWEDAYGKPRGPLPDFEAMKAGTDFVGSKITAVGLIAKIGHYLVIITEKNEEADEYEYSVVPLKAKIVIRYH
jgi:hypothetical protein